MATTNETALHVTAVRHERVKLRIIGNTPLYFNAMSAKARRDLLIGGSKKTAAQKAEIKHDPEQEYRNSAYRLPSGPTLLGVPSPAFKGAMATAALETPGAKKTQVNRLIFVPAEKVPVWGLPTLKMDVVRNSDINRTPDIRTRAFLPEWCAEIEVAYVVPQLSTLAVVTLLANAGVVVGVGDFRQEKGKGSYGTFSVYGSDMDDDAQAAWDRITRYGRAEQQVAMDDPQAADDETRELLALLRQERLRRAA
jgi:hypothetical protein